MSWSHERYTKSVLCHIKTFCSVTGMTARLPDRLVLPRELWPSFYKWKKNTRGFLFKDGFSFLLFLASSSEAYLASFSTPYLLNRQLPKKLALSPARRWSSQQHSGYGLTGSQISHLLRRVGTSFQVGPNQSPWPRLVEKWQWCISA